jgi:hypothetical protein
MRLEHNVAYELFTTKAIRLGSPSLTISPDARVALNADAGDLLGAGARFVQILWDAKAHKVALRPLAKPVESSYKLYIKGGKRGRHFSARSFLRFISSKTPAASTLSPPPMPLPAPESLPPACSREAASLRRVRTNM